MRDKSDEEIRKSIKRLEESLPESERNPDAQEDTQCLIERAAQPLPEDAVILLSPFLFSTIPTIAVLLSPWLF